MIEIKVRLIFLAGLILLSTGVFSQSDNDTVPKLNIDTVQVKAPNRLHVGCGYGLNFIGGTSINISPNLTYTLTDKIIFGAGIQGSFTSLKNIQSTITYGANVLVLFNPDKKILTSLEFSQLRVSTKTDADNTTKSYWDSALFLGAGCNITNKISVGAKYNFLYNEDKSIYTSPVIPFVNITF